LEILNLVSYPNPKGQSKAKQSKAMQEPEGAEQGLKLKNTNKINKELKKKKKYTPPPLLYW